MLTKFGLTENELTDYRQLMLMPENDENGFFDESIDVKIIQLKRLRLRGLQEQRNEVKVVADEESINGLDKIENK